MYNTINKNYRAKFLFGNNTSQQKYSKRVVEIIINEPAFSIMFIPHYDTDKYPFPPFKSNFNYIGEKYYKSDKRRIEGFYEGEIIFFEYNEKKGETFRLEFERVADQKKSHILIYCLDTETYNYLIKDLRSNFYRSPDSSKSDINGAWKHEYMMKAKSMQYIDGKLKELVTMLPDSVRKSLEMY